MVYNIFLTLQMRKQASEMASNSPNITQEATESQTWKSSRLEIFHNSDQHGCPNVTMKIKEKI
jgi:hypothetical protein